MIDSSIIQVLVVIGLPYAINALRSFTAKAPPPSPLQRLGKQNVPKASLAVTRWNSFVLVLLAMTLVYHLAALTLQTPPDIFKTLALPVDCPNFILHQSWKERAEVDSTFMTRFPDTLRERFKAMESRWLYKVYGHDAFLNCDHCSEPGDYLLYRIPGAMAAYVGSAILLGMATTATAHLNKYRTWGLAALALAAGVEYTAFSRGSEAGSLSAFLSVQGTAGALGAYRLRHGCLAIMTLLILGMLWRADRNGSNKPRDEVDILTDLCQAQEAMIGRHRALQLARVASLRDPLLRKQFVEYWKKREVEHGLLLSDLEYKEARDQAMSRIDVESVIQEANQYIESVVKTGERSSDSSQSSTSLS
ncbi:hypothetical protein BGZ83_000863 [Gryganskiella cystojenkinii]|nr:hypothetical protein BGZ83_000863 [Gryganskiella cystojenkinii]